MALGSAWRDSVSGEAPRVPHESHQRWRVRRLARIARTNGRHAVAGFVAALVCGCGVGPDFAPPSPPDVAGYTPGLPPARTVAADVSAGQSQRFVKGRDIP